MIVDDSFCRLTTRMIIVIARRESTIIYYDAPFDLGFNPEKLETLCGSWVLCHNVPYLAVKRA